MRIFGASWASLQYCYSTVKEPEVEKAHAYELSPRGHVIELIQKGGVSHLLMGIPAPVFYTDTVCALWK